jgi:hypothetical protein
MHAANGSNNAVKCKPATGLSDDEIEDNKTNNKTPQQLQEMSTTGIC